jgi:hypothetical protein
MIDPNERPPDSYSIFEPEVEAMNPPYVVPKNATGEEIEAIRKRYKQGFRNRAEMVEYMRGLELKGLAEDSEAAEQEDVIHPRIHDPNE